MISTRLEHGYKQITQGVSILYLPRLWFLLNERWIQSAFAEKSQSSIYRGYDFYTEIAFRHDGQTERSQSSIYRGYDFYSITGTRRTIQSARSQSSIYRGYDFYLMTLQTFRFCIKSLNPLSTEVMISTRQTSRVHQLQFVRVSILYLPRLWFLHSVSRYRRRRHRDVSILYLPRLWFLLAPIFTPSVLRVKGQLR